MNYRVNTSLCVVIFLLLLPALGYGQDDASKPVCPVDNTADSVYFKALQESARAINVKVCELIQTRTNYGEGVEVLLQKELNGFALQTELAITKHFSQENWSVLFEQLRLFQSTLGSYRSMGDVLPVFEYQKGLGGPRSATSYFFLTNATAKKMTIDSTNNGACKFFGADGPSCKKVFKDFAQAVYPYQRAINSADAQRTVKQLDGLSKQWDRYFDSARSQSFADIALTTLFERGHMNKTYLVGPPKRQWFTLHPRVLVENVEAAADGDNMKLGLAVEWLGVNWWQDSVIGIPFGVSAASFYTDRADVADVGHGVIFHFDNKYSVGISNRDGELGYSVTVDLLKAFTSKKEQFESYRSRLD